jgi:hypothetical protein
MIEISALEEKQKKSRDEIVLVARGYLKFSEERCL